MPSGICRAVLFAALAGAWCSGIIACRRLRQTSGVVTVLFSVHCISPQDRDANILCSLSTVSCTALNGICGLDTLEAKTHNRRVDIPRASLLFRVGASGDCFGLSGTYHKSIFLDSTKCRAVSAFSVWKRYWSTSLYVLSS